MAKPWEGEGLSPLRLSPSSSQPCRLGPSFPYVRRGFSGISADSAGVRAVFITMASKA